MVVVVVVVVVVVLLPPAYLGQRFLPLPTELDHLLTERHDGSLGLAHLGTVVPDQ